jgi:RNA polymerase sigma-70 factor, ECF subfamily
MEKVIVAETELACAGAVDFEALVQAHARFVFKVAFAIVRNAEDAEDVVQETFLRAFRSGEADKVERMRAWLARIAWRLAVDRMRKRPRNREANNPEHLLRFPSPRPCAEESLLHAERAALLERLIHGLPEDFRAPLQLSTVEGMTSAEIAEVLGVLESSVRTRLSRARKLLREKLAALMEGEYEA